MIQVGTCSCIITMIKCWCVHTSIVPYKRTATNIHIVSTFFYECLMRSRQTEGENSKLNITKEKSRKRKRDDISCYIKGEPGDLSLILVPICVSNSHWILCVSKKLHVIELTRIFYYMYIIFSILIADNRFSCQNCLLL